MMIPFNLWMIIIIIIVSWDYGITNNNLFLWIFSWQMYSVHVIHTFCFIDFSWFISIFLFYQFVKKKKGALKRKYIPCKIMYLHVWVCNCVQHQVWTHTKIVTIHSYSTDLDTCLFLKANIYTCTLVLYLKSKPCLSSWSHQVPY